MHFEEQLPELKKQSVHPSERQNERNLIQHALGTRAPEGKLEWALRYASAFGRLFDTDEAFYDLVKRAHLEKDPALLTRIQERLDAEPQE